MKSTIYRELVDQFFEKYAQATREDLKSLQTPDPKSKKAPPVKKYRFRFYEYQLNEIKELAKRTNYSVTEIFRMVIMEYLKDAFV
jgi:hypothetical protein